MAIVSSIRTAVLAGAGLVAFGAVPEAAASVGDIKKNADIFLFSPREETGAGSAQCKNRQGEVTFTSDAVDLIKAYEAAISVWEIKYDCTDGDCAVYESSIEEKEYCTVQGMTLRYWGSR